MLLLVGHILLPLSLLTVHLRLFPLSMFVKRTGAALFGGNPCGDEAELDTGASLRHRCDISRFRVPLTLDNSVPTHARACLLRATIPARQ